MKSFSSLIATGTLCIATSALAQVAVYDGATNILTLPAVRVGPSTYVNVTLLNTGNYTFALQGATAETAAASVTYDAATGIVNIPAVKVGAATYLDVKLLNVGNFVFTLQAASELPAALSSKVTALLASSDALWATAVPGSGATRLSLTDSCYLDDGGTKAYYVSYVDANLADVLKRDAFRIGEKRTNTQVLAVRNLTNPDSSTRQEIDVQYDITYTDGSVVIANPSTLISGSSAGSCATPQVSTELRFFGNRQLVQADVRARNQRDERYLISTGAPASPAVRYRRDVQFQIVDPMGNATYVIVSGNGPSAIVNGVQTPFSLKFISPRLLRSAAELVGKNGNYLNWLDDDSFRFCRISSTTDVPVASIADCVGQGATGNNWGINASSPNAAADTSFQNQGWLAGATYTFDVYSDDGWKTVNGHVGRTPIATYYTQLKNLPYSFVEMAGSGVTADKFPRITFGGMTPVQVRANIVSATPSAMNLAWTAIPALSDSRPFRLFQGYEFFQGPKTGNATGVDYPGYRLQVFNYPGSTATSISALQPTAKLTDMSSKGYEEFTLQYRDRNYGQILSVVSFN
jgi:hypothetical protein